MSTCREPGGDLTRVGEENLTSLLCSTGRETTLVRCRHATQRGRVTGLPRGGSASRGDRGAKTVHGCALTCLVLVLFRPGAVW